MSLEEILAKANACPADEAKKQFTKPRHDHEHNIQMACVRWFRAQYPGYPLFAVPNGGRRDAVTGAKLKAEGAMAGVSDIILLCPSKHHASLCIELKDKGNYQQQNQKVFQAMVEKFGNKYVVVHNLDEFMYEVETYIADR